jgi:hypothetical protein
VKRFVGRPSFVSFFLRLGYSIEIVSNVVNKGGTGKFIKTKLNGDI